MLYRILKSEIQNIHTLQSLQVRDMQRKTQMLVGVFKSIIMTEKQFSVFCNSPSLFVFLTAFPRLYPQL